MSKRKSKRNDPFKLPIQTGHNFMSIENVMLVFRVTWGEKSHEYQDLRKMIVKIEQDLHDLMWEEWDWNEKRKINDIIFTAIGDGYSIGFHPKTDNGEILRVATEIVGRIGNNGFKVRAGLTKGLNVRHVDKNELMSVFGPGVTLAFKVCDIAAENEILICDDYAKLLEVNHESVGLELIEKCVELSPNKTIALHRLPL